MDCSKCAMRGDPCERCKAVLQEELRINKREICPTFLANVVSKPKEAVPDGQRNHVSVDDLHARRS